MYESEKLAAYPNVDSTTAVSSGADKLAFVLGWLGFSFITAVLCLIAIVFIDVPVARIFSEALKYFPNSLGISSPRILAVNTVIALFVFARKWCFQSISQADEAIAISCCVVFGAFVINDLISKPLLSQIVSSARLSRASYSDFIFIRDNHFSSFPSGHAAIAASVLTVFWMCFGRYRPIYVAAMVVVSAVLVIGGWHFVSDIIGGCFIGFCTGTVTVSLWRRRVIKRDLPSILE